MLIRNPRDSDAEGHPREEAEGRAPGDVMEEAYGSTGLRVAGLVNMLGRDRWRMEASRTDDERAAGEYLQRGTSR